LQNLPPIVVRNYKGDHATALRSFQADATQLASYGYVPSTQSYAPGSYGCASFLLALLLCFLLIGFLVFIYMLIVKPPGTLTVTYQLAGSGAQHPGAPPTGSGAPGGFTPGR
jgi:hypothetical protein